MEHAAAKRVVQHRGATAEIEAVLSSRAAGQVTVEAMVVATGLPSGLVSTIMGRLAREGMPQGALTRPEGNPAGEFRWHPQGQRKTPLSVVHRTPRRPRRPRRSVCPDSILVNPSDEPQPAQDGSWVFFGESTGRPYRVVPL